MKNRKEAIIKSFSKMDIAMLELILDDSKTYQDATKEIFLQKLNDVFIEFKSSNDNSLIAFSGKCISDTCNKGCKGYSFVGNNSKNHTDFIFEEMETDYKDIYHCSHFKIDNPEIELSDDFPLFVLGDDKADFKPSVEYLAKAQQCVKAYEELACEGSIYTDKDDYLKWLKKHHKLYKSFEFPPLFEKPFRKFWKLYNDLIYFSAYIKFEDEAATANNEFDLFDTADEASLLKWLMNYDHMREELTLLPVEDLNTQKKLKTGYIKVSDNFYLPIDVEDYKNVICFKEICDVHYWEMLDKYNTPIEDDCETFAEKVEANKKNFSLKYHLERRGMLN